VDLGGPQRTQQRQAVHAGQHAVENHDAVIAGGREKQAFASVTGAIDGVAAFAQPLGQVGRRLTIVFDDKDLHRAKVRSVWDEDQVVLALEQSKRFAADPTCRGHVAIPCRFCLDRGAPSDDVLTDQIGPNSEVRPRER
jgi:hypothetical protein